jgi:prepilin-type N-terminal cleavage/methylation domain-containing protein
MQKLGVFIFKPAVSSNGYSLVEMMVCLSLLAIFAGMATPVWWPMVANMHLASARDALMNDVQTARVQALQLGTALTLSRLNDCAWAKADSNDWSCGWQLQRQDTQGVLLTHAIHTPLQLLLVNPKEFVIGARGELGSVGTRWSLSHSNASNLRQYVVCLNSAGRLRWQSGATCA